MPTTVELLTAALAGRYELARELGAGGMATVYLARDLKHDRDVAIKVLHPDLGAVLGADRFLAEIKTTAKLQHPHILPLLDSGAGNGLLYYVMPVITGESLRARLERENVLPISEAIRIASEVAAALDYAHRHGVVHRDIKPDNILLHDGSALVADFGISLAVQSAGGQRMTQTGLSLGTPQYMSPEQAMGERNMDGRADVYALGAVTYEMLTGDPPFTGSSVQSILAKVMNERPTSIATLRDTVPASVAQAVHTALAKLPADRFATAALFAEALKADRTAPVPTVVARPSRQSRALRKLAPMLSLAAANGVALGALITALISWSIGHYRGKAVVSPRRYTIVLPDSAPLVAGHDQYGNSRRAFDLSPDGSQLVYVAPASSGESTQLMLLPLNGKTPSVLAGTLGASGPVFSPDGHAIAYSVAGEVRRRSLDDGATVRLGEMPAVSDLSWAGDRIFASSWWDCLWSVPASGGDLKRLPTATACRANGAAPVDQTSDWLLTSDEGDIYGISKSSGKAQAVRTVAGTADVTVTGSFPRFVAPGFIVFLRDSVLFAAPFDPKGLRLTGDPQPVLGGFRREASYGQGHFAESKEGTVVWAAGSDGSVGNFVWVDRSGKIVERLPIAPGLVDGFVVSPDGKRIAINRPSLSGRGALYIADLMRHVVDSVAIPFDVTPRTWIRGGTALTVTDDSGSSNRPGLIAFANGTPTIDWKQQFIDESVDGASQCDNSRIWATAKPAEKAALDAGGSWCRYSPDGRYVAWVGRDGIYAAPVASASARVKIAPAGADEPIWTRDGREVLFRSARRWFTVPSPEGATGGPPAPKQLFEGDYLQAPGASWSLGPDGRFLLIEAPPQMRVTRLEVMTGFPRFLQERLSRQ